MNSSRRDFLQTGAAVVGAPAILRSQSRREQPNVLVIMSDEHNPRVTGLYGNRIVSTPNIDSLAAGGISFDTHYCNSPLCVPSRLSFTSGKYIHRVGAWNNDCRLKSDDIASLPHVMNAAGYESYLCGKQHYDSEHRYGFREIGGNMNNAFMNGKGNRRNADDTSVKEEAGRRRFAEFHSGDQSSVLNHDRRVTAGAVEFLSQRGKGEKPFFLFAGYLAPHFPLVVPDKYWQKYRDKIDMPEIPEGFLEHLPLNYKHLRRGFGVVDQPPEIVKRGRELYYGLTEWVDNEIGMVLAALRKSPFADNTVIIYTSDHGENMGEHGLWWKNAVYEQAARVPLVVNWPKRWKAGQRRTGATSHVDLVRTVADIGGARTPDDWNGQPLTRTLDDPKVAGRDIAVSQYYAHNIASGYAMLRSGDWKYVYHSVPDAQHKAERELYNIRADWKEFRNLAADPAQKDRVASMHARLEKELGESPDETEQRCRHDLARGYGRTRPKGVRNSDEQD